MTLYVYNPARERIGLVEDVRSLQWLSEYQDAGEIKLVCSATEKNRALLVDGNRLYCTEQPESAIIRQTQIDEVMNCSVSRLAVPLPMAIASI